MEENKKPNDLKSSPVQELRNLKVGDLDEFEAKKILHRLIAQGVVQLRK